MSTDPTTPPAVDEDAYAAGMRAGYTHGYDVGRAHGRAEHEIEHADLPRVRLDGPTREERIARGYIPIDHSRPPALPFRMWTAEEWAKADTRDLPINDYGRAQWSEAIAAGRVPPALADAFNSADTAAAADVGGEAGRVARPRSAAVVTDGITAAVADTGRHLAEARGHLDAAARETDDQEHARTRSRRHTDELDDTAVDALELAEGGSR